MPPVHVGIEVYSLLADPAERGQGKDLEAAGIGKDRPVPVHKPMEPAQPTDQPVAGTDMKMIGVGQLCLAPDGAQILGRETAFDGRLCADVHKNGRVYRPVGSRILAAPCPAFGFYQLEHGEYLSAIDLRHHTIDRRNGQPLPGLFPSIGCPPVRSWQRFFLKDE